jgi:endonuclease YncB( thermonuclease family)
MNQFKIALLTTLLFSQLALADTITGKVVSVADGDTVTILDEQHQQHRIRFAQIDAPETAHGKNKPAQAFGEKSKQSMADMVFGKIVKADCATTDRYGRSVCKVFVDGLDTNLEQVKRGMAMVYRQYAHDVAYYRAEDEAKAAHRGVWSETNPTPPWQWRHGDSVAAMNKDASGTVIY